MSKIVYMFPGQGAQYVGMGKDFYNTYPICKEIFAAASNKTGLNMEEICFEENENIHITEYTQAAMLTVCAAILEAMKIEQIPAPQFTAGLSLGEYGALLASDIITFEEAVSVVRKRGIYMQQEVAVGVGTMAAVLGLDAAKIEEICNEQDGVVEVANYNCPGQIVISGEKKAVNAAGEKLKEAGAKRVVELKVSGPFHCSLLKGAGEKLYKELEPVTLHDFSIPYVANVTANLVTDKGQIKELLKQQVYSSVRWQQSIELLLAQGVDTFIEVGPGRTLSGFVKKINRNAAVMNIDKVEDLEKVKKNIKKS